MVKLNNAEGKGVVLWKSVQMTDTPRASLWGLELVNTSAVFSEKLQLQQIRHLFFSETLCRTLTRWRSSWTNLRRICRSCRRSSSRRCSPRSSTTRSWRSGRTSNPTCASSTSVCACSASAPRTTASCSSTDTACARTMVIFPSKTNSMSTCEVINFANGQTA